MSLPSKTTQNYARIRCLRSLGVSRGDPRRNTAVNTAACQWFDALNKRHVPLEEGLHIVNAVDVFVEAGCLLVIVHQSLDCHTEVAEVGKPVTREKIILGARKHHLSGQKRRQTGGCNAGHFILQKKKMPLNEIHPLGYSVSRDAARTSSRSLRTPGAPLSTTRLSLSPKSS